jgi:hypothetical protein
MRRKILMGVLALALPVGTIAATQTTAFAKTVPNPVTCAGFSGTVTFGTPLTNAGVATSAKTANATTVSGGTFSCSGGIAPNTGGSGNDGAGLSIAGGKNVKLLKTDPRYNKTLGIKYVVGTWNEFAGSGGSLAKSLKVINFTIAGHATQFKAKSAHIVLFGVCGSDVGFTILGQVKAAPFADKTASVTACLGGDGGGTATGNFGADYTNAQGVTFATIDPAVSTATL